MPLFQKKPVVIEARQLTASNLDEIIHWVNSVSSRYLGRRQYALRHPLVLETLEGDHEVTIGDWIIKGVNDEFYRRKPDIFEMTYEPMIGGTNDSAGSEQ